MDLSLSDIKFLSEYLKLQLKYRTGKLSVKEKHRLSEIASTRRYGDRRLDAIKDLSFDLSSGKLNSLE